VPDVTGGSSPPSETPSRHRHRQLGDQRASSRFGSSRATCREKGHGHKLFLNALARGAKAVAFLQRSTSGEEMEVQTSGRHMKERGALEGIMQAHEEVRRDQNAACRSEGRIDNDIEFRIVQRAVVGPSNSQ